MSWHSYADNSWTLQGLELRFSQNQHWDSQSRSTVCLWRDTTFFGLGESKYKTGSWKIIYKGKIAQMWYLLVVGSFGKCFTSKNISMPKKYFCAKCQLITTFCLSKSHQTFIFLSSPETDFSPYKLPFPQLDSSINSYHEIGSFENRRQSEPADLGSCCSPSCLNSSWCIISYLWCLVCFVMVYHSSHSRLGQLVWGVTVSCILRAAAVQCQHEHDMTHS